MRAATYSIPLAAGDQGIAECVVNYFGPGQGGGVEANIERWKNQVQGADGKPALSKIDKRTGRGVPSRKILLAGFSQGGALAIHVALRVPQPLAGTIALSTYLVMGDTLEAEIASANRGLPVFQAHGNSDPMVPIERGEALRDALAEAGCEVEWHEYGMTHEVCLEEIEAIGAWMRLQLRD